MSIDASRFEALTFDCYGTLIDWETGLLDAMAAVLEPRGVAAEPEALLEAFGRRESAAETGEYRTYREVLATCLRGICSELGVEPTAADEAAFARSVADWPAFPDSRAALARLAERYRLGVITNCDDDLFAASARRLGVDFEVVVTAEQVRAYKPAERGFLASLQRLGLPRERVLHVAQSLYHDHVPAKRLGYATAWIDRRAGRGGPGATPPAEAHPDLVLPDLASLADALLVPGTGS
jgi:2-haloacid dehalogenase